MKRIALFLICGVSLTGEIAKACPCHDSPSSRPITQEELKKLRENRKTRRKARLPASHSLMPVLPTDWGGPDPSLLRPEAVLANAASRALNEAWSLPGTKDAIVAMPVLMLRSQYHPYGDGQTNSVASLGQWNGKVPPLVAVQITRSDGSTTVRFALDSSMKLQSPGLKVTQGERVEKVPLSRDRSNRWIGDWKPASQAPVWVQPDGWSEGFPLGFQQPVYSIETLRALSGNNSLPDPEGIAKESVSLELSPFETLLRHSFGSAFNSTPYNPRNIHAEYPSAGGTVTAVGQGWTWVADKPGAPFKTLYTCFERRQPEQEAHAKDGGVVSGGGWHEIGDPAETIINSLEADPVAVGWATLSPMASPPGRTFSYRLKDVATIRWLRPREAMLTQAGDFHWFFFQSDREVCTEEWVHPCVPTKSNALGFKCGN